MTDDKGKSRIALFVDFDHLRRHTDGARQPVCPLPSAIEAIVCRVQELGDVVTANVYADWDNLPGKQAEVKRLHLDPRFVFSGPGTTDLNVARTNGNILTLALDVQASLYERDDIDMYVVVSVEAGMIDLVGRLKARGKSAMLIGFEQSLSPDVRDAAIDFEPIESYVQLTGDMRQTAEVQPDTRPTAEPQPDTPPSPEEFESSEAADDFDWQPFILLLNRLENNLPFVSLKYLKNQVLTTAHGCENTMDSKASLIREAIRLHYIETAKVPNPRNPNFDTTTCRLNRRNPAVQLVLGS